MTALDRLIPAPAMVEIDHVVVAAQPAEVWKRVRHADLASSPLIRALFAIRTLPSRWHVQRVSPSGSSSNNQGSPWIDAC